ncbi:MULE domain-containing protein, partial [Aphis craccivora]
YYICSCSNVTCKATIKRKIDGSIVLGKPHTHDLSINEEKITKINFRKALIDRAAGETTLLKIIYDEEAIRNPDAANIYTWPTAESSMRRARCKNVPVLPAALYALGETLDENQNLVKCNNHQFYQECIVDDLGKCHIMFACPEVVNRVELNGEIEMHADATFKVVPSIPKCYQLFIIHMIIQNHSIPICYVLMESKTQVAYEKVITQFNTIFPNIQPSIIMTDYEIGLRNAFRKVYPNADMSLWKNIKKLNFTTYIRNNETAKMCVKMVMVLALLPANEIDTGHWLIRTGPTVFSVYGQARRTNNNVESFHNKLKDTFQVRHPNLWKVLGHLSDCSKLQHIVIG